ncbi:MAG: zf-HC2 domain-containing protein [Firmicutes bacterium]|nr:zf-HC2 domain-containing protein [Bacillota bacterium]
MECTKIKAKLADYSVGLLAEREKQMVEAHLAQCPSCAAELRALERVDRVLRTVEPEEPPAHLWNSIRARIEAEPQRVQIPFWQRWFSVPRLALGGAAAAAVLVAIAYFSLPRSPEGDAPQHDNAEQLMHTHQMMSWGDPLSDKAALGVMLASRSQPQEVP